MKKPQTTVLTEAQALIYGDRQEVYGSATQNFTDTARMWSVIAGVDLTAEQVAMMMVALKLCRQLHRPKRDNIIDACGYLGCIEKIENGL